MTIDRKRELIVPTDSEKSVAEQCRLLGLARSSYYYQPWEWDDAALEVMREIDEEYTRHPFRGKRGMCDYLQKRGYPIGVKRTRRLMKWMGLISTAPGPHTSKPHPEHRKFPYLLKNLEITTPNQVWATDITYIRMQRGFVYLTAVLDWYSRYVITWELSTTLDSEFCVHCVEDAFRVGCPEIFNSDQGAQYTSNEFIETLERRPLRISMDGQGRAFDNIMVERLWRTVKYEEVYLKDYADVADCRRSLSEYFRFYNDERHHTSLGRTPSEAYFDRKL